MDSGNSRVRWTPAELEQVAVEMSRLLAVDPTLGQLDAVRGAQSVLPAERQRDIKAWTLVSARLEPYLVKAAEQKSAAHPQVSAGDSMKNSSASAGSAREPVEVLQPQAAPSSVRDDSPQASPPADDSAKPAQSTEASGSLDKGPAPEFSSSALSLMAEAGLVTALQSPAVRQALVEVFAQAMGQALSRMSAAGSARFEDSQDARATGPQSDMRVLLAGFAAPQAKQLEASIQNLCEVRVWKPVQGAHVFETLAGLCQVAVMPDDADDEVVSDLRRRNVTVLRHSGSVAKLMERLEEVLA